MRILLLGASGYVGHYLASRLCRDHEVTGTYRYEERARPGCALRKLDLTRAGELGSLIEDASPRLIVNAAAMAGPDACEDDPEAARRVNVEGAEAAAKAAAKAGARLFFFSTDQVFDGEDAPFPEDREPNPGNIYAEGKLGAERRVREACPDAVILRLSLGYGWKKIGRLMFCDVMYRNLSAGKGIRLFTDQFRSMLYLEDAAEMVARLAKKPALETAGLLLHMAGPERVSRMRFGEAFCDAFGFDRKLLDAGRVADLELPAPRPRDCSLDGARLNELIGFRPRDIESGLRAMAENRPSIPADL